MKKKWKWRRSRRKNIIQPFRSTRNIDVGVSAFLFRRWPFSLILFLNLPEIFVCIILKEPEQFNVTMSPNFVVIASSTDKKKRENERKEGRIYIVRWIQKVLSNCLQPPSLLQPSPLKFEAIVHNLGKFCDYECEYRTGTYGTHLGHLQLDTSRRQNTKPNRTDSRNSKVCENMVLKNWEGLEGRLGYSSTGGNWRVPAKLDLFYEKKNFFLGLGNSEQSRPHTIQTIYSKDYNNIIAFVLLMSFVSLLFFLFLFF